MNYSVSSGTSNIPDNNLQLSKSMHVVLITDVTLTQSQIDKIIPSPEKCFLEDGELRLIPGGRGLSLHFPLPFYHFTDWLG